MRTQINFRLTEKDDALLVRLKQAREYENNTATDLFRMGLAALAERIGVKA